MPEIRQHNCNPHFRGCRSEVRGGTYCNRIILQEYSLLPAGPSFSDGDFALDDERIFYLSFVMKKHKTYKHNNIYLYIFFFNCNIVNNIQFSMVSSRCLTFHEGDGQGLASLVTLLQTREQFYAF